MLHVVRITDGGIAAGEKNSKTSKTSVTVIVCKTVGPECHFVIVESTQVYETKCNAVSGEKCSS